MSFLKFTDVSDRTMKTKRWVIYNNTNGAMLGWIQYYAQWRKYVWTMAEGVLFDVACTQEVVDFLTANKDARN